MIDGSQVSDSTSVMVIKNNVTLVSKVILYSILLVDS